MARLRLAVVGLMIEDVKSDWLVSCQRRESWRSLVAFCVETWDAESLYRHRRSKVQRSEVLPVSEMRFTELAGFRRNDLVERPLLFRRAFGDMRSSGGTHGVDPFHIVAGECITTDLPREGIMQARCLEASLPRSTHHL